MQNIGEIGEIKVDVVYKNKVVNCSMVVLKRHDETALMGRELMKAFKFVKSIRLR